MSTNSASRLHVALTDALSKPGNTNTRQMWSTVLGTEPNDDAAFMKAFLDLNKLVAESVEDVQGIEGIDEKLFLGWVKPVKNVVALGNHHQPWEKVNGALSPTVMQALAFSAHELAKRPEEQDIDPAELARLQNEVEMLQERLIKSKLDPTVKAVLVQQLDNMRYGLQAYRLRGAHAIRDALASALGSVFLNRDLFLAAAEEPEVKDFTKVLAWADKLAALALKVKQLAGPVLKYLAD